MRIRMDHVSDADFPDAQLYDGRARYYIDYNGKSLKKEMILAIDTETGDAICLEISDSGAPKLSDDGKDVVRVRKSFVAPLTQRFN